MLKYFVINFGVKKITVYHFFIGFLFVFAWYRAVQLSITHDEAYSLLNVVHINFNLMYGTANTHWLNSICMKISTFFLGYTGIRYRLHSVISIIFFSYFIIKIFKEYKSSILILIPIVLLLLNHYLLDYFSLARGYGMSIMFDTIGFYYIIQHNEKEKFNIYLFLALAVFANYASIYILYCYFMVDCVKLCFRDRKLLFLLSKSFYKNISPLILVSLWAIPNIYFIKYISKDLGAGEWNGFIKDTLGVFFEKSYLISNEILLQMLCGISFWAMVLYVVFNFKKIPNGFKSMFFLLFANFLLIQLLRYGLKIPFPSARTSLFFIVPFLICFSYFLIDILQSFYVIIQYFFTIGLIAVILWFNIIKIDFSLTTDWPMQQGIEKCFIDLFEIEKANIQNCKIAMHCGHFGVYQNYYSFFKPNEYSSKVIYYGRFDDDNLSKEDCKYLNKQDYLFMYGNYESELYTFLDKSKLVMIRHYEKQQVDLLKVIH